MIRRAQVWRWAGQYKASLLDGEAPLPEMLRLGEWLAAHIPLNDSDPAITRISHGDFRFIMHPPGSKACCFRECQGAGCSIPWHVSTHHCC